MILWIFICRECCVCQEVLFYYHYYFAELCICGWRCHSASQVSVMEEILKWTVLCRKHSFSSSSWCIRRENFPPLVYRPVWPHSLLGKDRPAHSCWCQECCYWLCSPNHAVSACSRLLTANKALSEGKKWDQSEIYDNSRHRISNMNRWALKNGKVFFTYKYFRGKKNNRMNYNKHFF